MSRQKTLAGRETIIPAEGEFNFQVSKNRGRGIFLEHILQHGSEWVDLTSLAVDCGLTGSFLGCEIAGHGNWMNDKARPRLGGVAPFQFSSDLKDMGAGMIRVNPEVEFINLGEGSRSDYVKYKIRKKADE